ncbi:MAG: L-sorbosone dehydrogenase [Candidatus Gottesmanbacteria bacterium GW2011_GWA2_47_9]|uniref:L-sorbosone dehydrogenase n=2 Tax=Candidatus Gottesmaniibacteriota TaxID=1752720 RepID=A0A0G1XNH1_9BACT|nr:MAG: L-sorbosone dehydrogenase [Candidatus Gottesmanbacteria bacterium GW2011_GWA2_47_9]KKU95885.1 MAG: L-sorbosone dehydrogenase [Candidatus Gottesmanbacteria bacterium GW2011_GWA1_48_13]
MKKQLVIVGLVVVGFAIWAGRFYYRNLRGAAPAVLPPAKEITKSENTTGLPLTLPPGFSISIFAKDLDGPRVLVQDMTRTVLVSVPGSGKVVALPDVNSDGVAHETKTVVDGLNRPHGLAFRGGKLYIAETDQVAVYDYDPKVFKATNKKKLVDLPGGGNHFSRTIAFGPDGKLYGTVGSSCNVCRESDRLRAAMFVANPDGSDVKVFAQGLRNAVFFTWHPTTRALWATEMGRDLLGDDIPPDEINIVKEGENYGWPICYGKQIADRELTKNSNPNHISPEAVCTSTTMPSHIDLPAHSAPLGLAFIPDSWPAEYRDDLLVAYHGSWNRTEPTGYKVMRMKLDEKGNYLGAEDFITGWLTEGGVSGRPVDLLFDSDGSLYISDDKAGIIYRVERRQKITHYLQFVDG